MKLSASASILAIALVVGGCGLDSQQNNEDNQNVDTVLDGAEQSAAEAANKNVPTQLVTRIPVVNGVAQHDKAEVVHVNSALETSSPAAIENAFNSGEKSKAILINSEMDQVSSADSWWGGWRYRAGYRRGYRHAAYRGAYRGGCVTAGCGARVAYRTGYAYRGVVRTAYRPYAVGFGCNRGGYYYSSYRATTGWYGYRGATCVRAGGCGVGGGVVYRTW